MHRFSSPCRIQSSIASNNKHDEIEFVVAPILPLFPLTYQVEILIDDTIVEAGTLGTVVTTAPLYDPNSAADNGCEPDGCIGALTRVS